MMLSLGNEVYGTAQLFKGSSLVNFKEKVIIGMIVQFHFQMKKENLSVVQSIKVNKGTGLVGDQFKGSSSGKREETPIQEQHLNTISSILGRKKIDPKLARRNIVVSGINRLSLKQHQFRIGGVILETTGICAPYSRIEENLGVGGYNAMSGHGGITATVIQEGEIKLGDTIKLI